MSTVATMAADLETALRGLRGVRVHTDMAATLAPPAVVIGPPTLRWGSVASEPDSVTFPLYLVTTADDRAQERLWDLVPQVAEAVESVADAVVRTATPGLFNSGGTDLPSYTLTAELAVG